MMLTDLDSNERTRVMAIGRGTGLLQWPLINHIAEDCTLKIISCSRRPVTLEVKRSSPSMRMARKMSVMRLNGC